MSTKTASKAKNKKPLETTLGKAPPATSPNDLSHLGKPIETSIFGLKHVLNLYETATEEVRRYVTYECEIMYECRICRTIFRSLANFILHKRNYCQESFHSTFPHNSSEKSVHVLQDKDLELINRRTSPSPVTSDLKQSLEQDLRSILDEPESKEKKCLDSVVGLLKERQASALITEQCLNEDISDESLVSETTSSHNDVALQKIQDSTTGVFQTLFNSRGSEINKNNLMKTEVMEIHSILDNNEAILGCDGKIIENGRLKDYDFVCTVCNNKFSTQKTLTYHIKFKHNNSRMVYQCPQCKDIFANAWSVFRHLYKIHHKSTAQVKKLRNQVHSSIIRRDEIPEEKSPCTSRRNSLSFAAQRSLEVENQWLDNFELDNDVQRCGGCGRKFERKAALHSHSQFCAKRIAVCNSIKEAKKVQVGEKAVDKASEILTNERNVHGSKRRKPQIAQKLYRVDYTANSSNKQTDKVDSDDNNFECTVISQALGPVIEIVDSSDEDFQGFDSKPCKNTEKHLTIIKVETEDEDEPKDVRVISSSSSDDTLSQDFRLHFQSDTSVIKCEMANNKRQGELLLSDDVKKAKTDPPDDCQEIEDASNLMLETTSTDYIDLEKLSCLPCNKIFATKTLLLSHMAQHFTWYRYQCMNCSYKSYDKLPCEEHVYLEHNIDEGTKVQNIVQPLPIFKAVNMCSSFISLVTEQTKTELVQDEEHKEEIKETVAEAVASVNENATVTDETTQDSQQNPVLMNMIMEVIFGGSNDTPSKGPDSTNESNDSTHTSNSSTENDLELPKKVKSSAKLSKKSSNSKKKVKSKKPVKVEMSEPLSEEISTAAEPIMPTLKPEVEVAELLPSCDLTIEKPEIDLKDQQDLIEEPCLQKSEICTDSKSPESDKTSPGRDTARPIRNRVVPIQKDFLYDMRTLLKQNLMNLTVANKCSQKKPKIVKHCVSKVKEKPSELNGTEIDLCDSTLDIVNNVKEDVNMNSKLAPHITGDGR